MSFAIFTGASEQHSFACESAGIKADLRSSMLVQSTAVEYSAARVGVCVQDSTGSDDGALGSVELGDPRSPPHCGERECFRADVKDALRAISLAAGEYTKNPREHLRVY